MHVSILCLSLYNCTRSICTLHHCVFLRAWLVRLCIEPFTTDFSIGIMVTHEAWILPVLQSVICQVTLKREHFTTSVAGILLLQMSVLVSSQRVWVVEDYFTFVTLYWGMISEIMLVCTCLGVCNHGTYFTVKTSHFFQLL